MDIHGPYPLLYDLGMALKLAVQTFVSKFVITDVIFKISLFDLKVIGSDETRRKLVIKILTLRAEKLFPRKL